MPRIVKIVVAVAIAVPVLGIGAAVVSALLVSERMKGNEASAIGSIRSVVSAQMTHAAMCNGAYAPTLARLAAQGYLQPELASDPAQQVGYGFTLQAGPIDDTVAGAPNCLGAVRDFTVTAAPLEPGTTGLRYFRADGTGTVVQASSVAFTDAAPLK